ncbi:MAG: glycoside hydrolase family 47 protein, partial [Bacteroidota bacterium]
MKPAYLFLLFGLFIACQSEPAPTTDPAPAAAPVYANTAELAATVKAETARAWAGYERYAWGHDVLHPLSKGYHDWYAEPLAISLIDGYSTLKIMGLEEETRRIETYVTDTVDFDRDIFV